MVSTPPEFTHDWFSMHIPTWESHLLCLAGRPIRILEVGSYEGRSALWLAENLMTNSDSSLLCVDVGVGVGHEGQLHRLCRNLDTSPHRGRISLRMEDSFTLLPTLPANTFDLVYIDGSHFGGDTIRDLCNAWPLLRAGGLLVIDDYLHRLAGHSPHAWPGPAIDYFLSLYQDQLQVIHKGYQVLLRKVVAPAAQEKPTK